MSFSQTAMLVSLNVRAYSARKDDKKVSREVAETHGTTEDCGRYAKSLVAKASLEPVMKAAGLLRAYHYDNSLPWIDDGIRILPAANFQHYRGDMESLKDSYDSAVRGFIANWPTIINEARIRLNGLFNIHDYPVDISNRFGCSLRFMPIPDSSDFRVAISDLERETLKDQIASTLNEAQSLAMRELWERVSVAVKAMAAKLAAYKRDENGKAENPFRDSLVENLRDLCTLLPRLNFTNDPRLIAVHRDIESTLLKHTAADLRESELLRANVAERAEHIAGNIAASLSEFMV